MLAYRDQWLLAGLLIESVSIIVFNKDIISFINQLRHECWKIDDLLDQAIGFMSNDDMWYI